MQNPIHFFRSVKQEIFKITWPTRKETLMGSVTVIAMAVIASLFFLLLDQIFKVGLNFLIGA
jgi:preprotein translocase subunit SecE